MLKRRRAGISPLINLLAEVCGRQLLHSVRCDMLKKIGWAEGFPWLQHIEKF
jgi:hypothetical protein